MDNSVEVTPGAAYLTAGGYIVLLKGYKGDDRIVGYIMGHPKFGPRFYWYWRLDGTFPYDGRSIDELCIVKKLSPPETE